MNGCPICGDERGWCEFCPRDNGNPIPGEHETQRIPDGLDFVREQMRRIETWASNSAREPARSVADVTFIDGRIGLTFADGSANVIG